MKTQLVSKAEIRPATYCEERPETDLVLEEIGGPALRRRSAEARLIISRIAGRDVGPGLYGLSARSQNQQTQEPSRPVNHL